MHTCEKPRDYWVSIPAGAAWTIKMKIRGVEARVTAGQHTVYFKSMNDAGFTTIKNIMKVKATAMLAA